MAKKYYGGVLLPEMSALDGYPYFWIRKNTSTGYYDLVYSASKWYYSGAMEGGSGSEIWYRIQISAASSQTSWTYYTTTTGNFGIDSARPVLWANEDVPSGSPTSTNIYFKSTPTNWGWTVTEATSAATLTASIEAETGTWVLATVAVRSTFTPPAGWTVLRESSTIDSNQRMIFLCKRCDSSGSVSFTAIQASAERIYLNLIAIIGCHGFKYHEGSEKKYPASTVINISRPTYNKIIWGMTATYWDTSSPHYVWTCDSLPSSSAVQLPNTTQPRLANFYDDDDTASNRVFTGGQISNTGPYVVDFVEIVTHVVHYASEGDATFSVTGIRSVSEYASSKLQWEEEILEDTSIEVYAKVDNGEYVECINGEEIGCLTQGEDYSDSTLYVKFVLKTENSSVTPSVSNIYLEIHDAQDDRVIVLTLNSGNQNSIQNSIGDVTVSYAGGTLIGEGGPVEGFSEPFTPEDLTYKGNQHDAEHIEVDISVTGSFQEVEYINTMENEHIEVDISVSADFIDVRDI